MNREIKFRGKTKNGEWRFGFYHKDKDGDYILTEINVFEVLPETIGQFTGLHDKNGKEIYEGDIIKFIHSPEYLKNTLVGVVITDKYNNWCLKINQEIHNKLGYKDENEFHIENAINSDLIGNIHDNKEMLSN